MERIVKRERELIRGAGPVAVLQLLQRGEMYGYEIAETLSRRTSGVLAMGQSTLYPLLYSLESKGLVESRWAEADSGRKRRYYKLTEEGEAFLDQRRTEWRELFAAMAGLGVVGEVTA